MATERIIVHSSIVTPFIKVLKESIDKIFSPSAPAPSLISVASVEKVKKLVSDAVEKGATTLHGSINDIAAERPSSFRPIVLTDIDTKMDLHYTESFGPVVCVYTFETEEEALAIANDTEYGLAGAVFTENLATGLRIAKGYETGAVHINSMTVHDEASLPHGGMKKSGFGRFNASQGLDEFLRTKVITWED
jgi:acyl-CoA reductase-like NAD-dependent aldehyde dehydrogenase